MRLSLRTMAIGAALISLFTATPALAHHSNAMFDRDKVVEVKGTVREFQWTNPHIWIELMLPGDAGQTSEYSIEGPAPGVLRNIGWKFNTLKVGDKVAVKVHPLKTGKPGGGLISVTLPSGQTMSYAPPPPVAGGTK